MCCYKKSWLACRSMQSERSVRKVLGSDCWSCSGYHSSPQQLHKLQERKAASACRIFSQETVIEWCASCNTLSSTHYTHSVYFSSPDLWLVFQDKPHAQSSLTVSFLLTISQGEMECSLKPGYFSIHIVYKEADLGKRKQIFWLMWLNSLFRWQIKIIRCTLPLARLFNKALFLVVMA